MFIRMFMCVQDRCTFLSAFTSFYFVNFVYFHIIIIYLINIQFFYYHVLYMTLRLLGTETLICFQTIFYFLFIFTIKLKLRLSYSKLNFEKYCKYCKYNKFKHCYFLFIEEKQMEKSMCIMK